MRKLVVVTVVAALACTAFATEVLVSPENANTIRSQVDLGGQRTIPVYDPLEVGVISRPNFLDVDAFQTIAPATGFTIDGFSLAWGELIVPTSEPLTYGTVTVAMWDIVTGNLLQDVDGVTPLGAFTFNIQTQHYPGYEGYYYVRSGSYTIPDPNDYVTFSSNNVWFGYVFSHLNGEFDLAHADDDTSADIGVNLNSLAWFGLATDGWHNYWFGGTPNGDLYGDLNMIPEPASLLLVVLGGLFIRRR